MVESRGIGQSESGAISIMRILAMFSIIVCHLLQAYNNRYCWLFNIGVWVFLAISGYLYGCKVIEDWGHWFKTRFKKLYIPYILFLLACIPFYYIFVPEKISVSQIIVHVVDLQGIVGNGIVGLSHLWFMSIIALCYLATPILQYLRRFSMVLYIFTILSLMNFFVFKIEVSVFSCFFVYALCYLWGQTSRKKNLILSLIVALFGGSLATISWNEILDYENSKNQLFHAVSALLFVEMGILYSKFFDCSFRNKWLKAVDHNSYEVYITHHIFILGPFSLMAFSPFSWMNVVWVLILSILTAVVLQKVSLKLSKYMHI